MSKSEFRRGGNGRDSYFSPVELRKSKKNYKKFTEVDGVFDDLDQGPSRVRNSRGSSKYTRRYKLIDFNLFWKMLSSQKGKSWDEVYSCMIAKCKGALQKEEMKNLLHSQKQTEDEIKDILYTSKDGTVYANTNYRGFSIYVDKKGVIQVVKNKRKPYTNTAKLKHKTHMLKADPSFKKWFVLDAGVWFVCEALTLDARQLQDMQLTSDSPYYSQSYLGFKEWDSYCYFWSEEAKKYVLLISKRSANHKEVLQAVALQKQVLKICDQEV